MNLLRDGRTLRDARRAYARSVRGPDRLVRRRGGWVHRARGRRRGVHGPAASLHRGERADGRTRGRRLPRRRRLLKRRRRDGRVRLRRRTERRSPRANIRRLGLRRGDGGFRRLRLRRLRSRRRRCSRLRLRSRRRLRFRLRRRHLPARGRDARLSRSGHPRTLSSDAPSGSFRLGGTPRRRAIRLLLPPRFVLRHLHAHET